MSTIGECIKRRRMSLGFSAEDLADRVGVSHATMYRYENGEIKDLKTSRLAKIAEVLQTTPADLMGLEDLSSEPKVHTHVRQNKIKTKEVVVRGQKFTQIELAEKGIAARFSDPRNYSKEPDLDDIISQLAELKKKNGLSKDEKDLVESYRKLDSTAREAILRFAHSFIKDMTDE